MSSNTSNSTPTILVANPGAQYLAYKNEIQSAIERVLQSGWYILGEEVSKFEKDFAKFVGVKHCIGVGNGTDAVAIALRAAGVTPGDEVITVSHSAVATVAAIEQIGAVPVLVDIEPDSRCMDPEKISALISKKTKAIVPVHIYGQPARIKEIVKVAIHNGLVVIEDCAQAHGARVDGQMVGSFGDLAAFSFYPTKNLGAIGDGGGVVTNSDTFAENANMLRQYGWRKRYISDVAGVNTRLDELQAAILSVKLPYLLRDNEKRRAIASQYNQALANSNIKTPKFFPGTDHAMHLYVVELDKRDQMREFLQTKGIQAAMHYPQSIHQQTAYFNRLRGFEKLNYTEKLYRELLTIPLYPELNDRQVSQVVNSLKEFARQ